jgi:hypothetical protein
VVEIDIKIGTSEFHAKGDTADVTPLYGEWLQAIRQMPSIAEVYQYSNPVEDDTEPTGATDAAAPKTSSKRKNSAPRSENLKFNDDLAGAVNVTDLRKFYGDKNPTSDSDSIAVFAHFLAKNAGKDDFDKDDIYTAFKMVQAKPPKNVGTALSDCKIKANTIAPTTRGRFKLNAHGESTVEHDLPRVAAK